MDRRSYLAAIGTSASISTAGCLDGVGSLLPGEDYEEKVITSARAGSDHPAITVTATTQRHFTEASPAMLAIELSNHDRTRTFLFSGYPAPWINILQHDSSGYRMGSVLRRESESSPAERTDDCWRFLGLPPRPSVYAPTTLNPGEAVTSEYILGGLPVDDGQSDTCNPSGSYTGEDEIEFVHGEHDGSIHGDDDPETVTLTLAFTLTRL